MDLLDKMATYVRVIEAGSFSAAAKQLRISAAAVSRQIATLEAELQTPLVLRTTRSMTVTSAGQSYYERCLRILREVDDAQAIGCGGGLDGIVKLNAPVTFGLATVVPALRTLKREHPTLRIDLRLEDRMVDLVLEGVDVAIRTSSLPPESADLVAHKLFTFERVIVAAPSYLKRRGTPKTPESLAKHDALSHAFDAAGETWQLRSVERTARIRMNVVVTSNAGHVLRELARDGSGVALLPEWFVRHDISRGTLRMLCPGWHSERVMVHALHRTIHRGEQRVRTLVSHLKTAYADLQSVAP
jgi:DNA-binding transcriptional LysR family regulator